MSKSHSRRSIFILHPAMKMSVILHPASILTLIPHPASRKRYVGRDVTKFKLWSLRCHWLAVKSLSLSSDCKDSQTSIDLLTCETSRFFFKNCDFFLLQADKSRGWSNWGNWSPCDKQCTRERERFCSAENLKRCPGATESNRVEVKKGKCRSQECYGEFEIINEIGTKTKPVLMRTGEWFG